MTTVTITGTIPGQYTLAAPGNVLSVTTTGYIDGGGTTGGVFSPGIGAGDTIFNDGRIKGGSYGVELAGSGTITNGSATDTTASIVGGSDGIYAFSSGGHSISIANFGTISSKPTTGYQAALLVEGEGTVTNGSLSDEAALIEGGVLTTGGGQITNFATITSTNKDGWGVEGADLVVNGASSDSSATIYGYNAGVEDAGVTNFGTIKSHLDGLVGGGVNGASEGSSALIEGSTGALVGTSDYGAAVTLTNHGTVLGTSSDGISVGADGYVYNGGPTDTAAVIKGFPGVYMSFGVLANYGTIVGQAPSSSSLAFGAGGSGLVVNGSSTDSNALIEGVDYGVELAGHVNNFGTIEATAASGYAVKLLEGADIGSELIVHAGSVLIGKISGGGIGELDFASGTTGKITELSDSGIVANGTDYQDFDDLQLASGATFTLSETGSVSSTGVANLDVAGSLDVTGSLVVTYLLADTGLIGGAGHLELKGGASSFTAGSLSVANVLVAGASTLVEVNGDLDYAGDWRQTGGTVRVASGDLLELTGVGDALSGSVTGAGAILVSGAGDTFDGLTLSLSTAVISDGSATNAGLLETTGATHLGIHATTIVNSGGTISASAGTWIQLQGVDVEGGALSSTGTGRIKINGASNEIDGGSSSISLAGEIVVQTGATLTGVGAVAFSGQLVAEGDIAISGPVSGAGELIIDGGRASFGSAFSHAVAFDGAGALVLADSQGFSGSVARFGVARADTLDLEDITFGDSTGATFSGTRSGGILTVTDGTHTARIALKGDYLASTFTVANDGTGGTVVTDPKASAPAMASAMAAFTPASAAASPAVAPTAQSLAASLIPPHG